MSNVVPFKRPEKREPTLSGEAHCLEPACKHQFVATAPVGTHMLECPKCESYKAVWRNYVDPGEGVKRFECNCGNQLFFVAPDRSIFCPTCGITHATL